MKKPVKNDFVAWYHFIHEKGQVKAKVFQDYHKLSNAEKFRLSRHALQSDLLFWRSEKTRWAKDSKKLEEIEPKIAALNRRIADHFADVVLTALSCQVDEASELLDELSAFSKVLPKGGRLKNHDLTVPVGKALQLFMHQERWPSRSEVQKACEDRGYDVSSSRLSGALQFFEVADWVCDKRGPKKENST